MSARSGRVTALREVEGLTKEEFAERCGVTRRTVSDWEAGRVEKPPIDEIAAEFDVTPSFFEGPELETLPASAVSFRALTRLSARQAKQVLSSARVSMQLFAWIDERFRTPLVDLPALDGLAPQFSREDPSPSDAANLLRSFWRLGDKPISNMLALVERKGIRVLALPAGQRDVDAFSFWRLGQPFIFLNVDKTSERVRFDLAHELGHLFMHQGVATSRDRVYEHDANVFASCFLIPSNELVAHVATARRPLRLGDVFILKKSWKTSALAMVRRLNDLHIINDWQYRNWMVELGSRGYRTAEPDGIDREMSLLLRDVLALAREDGLSFPELAKQTHIPVRVLEAAIMGLAMVPLRGADRRLRQSSEALSSEVLAHWDLRQVQ